ncbi:MAG TPA: tetratricopeptide repeat protein [Ramlibacter sp.]|uniref:tetratricopeptide repeat protein n=1 Tax=Ramlibacter sp. TaxID=1917967 RepID=UPI002BD3D5C1|nr:tetratricopeptide repeat protein [Ramlibacter sp.]HVZ45857.1 tetratricopeptide repeat protein [Ramlibacter sp.]
MRPVVRMRLATATALIAVPFAALGAVDVDALWNFDNPAQSEERFSAALASAEGDDALILRTQIARSYGLRGDFARARGILADVQSRLAGAGAEARVRYLLELGRTYVSATHPPASQTADAREAARRAYLDAIDQARRAGLDALAIDGLHMLAFVDTGPADELRWGREALAIALASSQPAARKWQASLRNNIGYALHELGRYDEALQEFEEALALRERGGNAEATRIARWMVAWTLRSMKRFDEALAIQLRLEREWQDAGGSDPDVFEELAHLYRAKGDEATAREYDAKAKSGSK